MAAIRIPQWKKDQIDHKFKRKNMVINKALKATESVLNNAVDYIVEHGFKTGLWAAPSLNELYAISETFYRDVISQAYYACQQDKKIITHKKKLAKNPWPTGIPRDLKGLEKIFRDKRAWPVIMKRSKKIVDRVRKQYLSLLQRKFARIVPKLREGTTTVKKAKKELMEVWETSKIRVELIFRTETTTYFGKVQVSFFNDDDGIIGFIFDSVRDIAGTEICRARHGLIFTKEHTGELSLSRNTPALHYNCRSHLIPLENSPQNVKLIKDPRLDPASPSNRAKIEAADRFEKKIRF